VPAPVYAENTIVCGAGENNICGGNAAAGSLLAGMWSSLSLVWISPDLSGWGWLLELLSPGLQCILVDNVCVSVGQTTQLCQVRQRR